MSDNHGTARRPAWLAYGMAGEKAQRFQGNAWRKLFQYMSTI